MTQQGCRFNGGNPCYNGNCALCVLAEIADALSTIKSSLEEMSYTLEYGNKATRDAKE